MTKYSLDIEYETEFDLLGITTYLADYRLTWLVNKLFSLRLTRTDDIQSEAQSKTRTEDLFAIPEESERFATYSFRNDDHSEEVKLIANRKNGRLLLKKFRKIDFFLRIDCSEHTVAEYSKILLEQDHVQAIRPIDPAILKNDIDIFYTNE